MCAHTNHFFILTEMKVRIKDIAQQAGVSTGTVDRVIHNRGNVAPNVKERVLKVMSELGYKRNLLASTLAYNRTLNIGVLTFGEEDPYWHQIRAGIELAQQRTTHYGVQVDVLVCDQTSPETFRKNVDALIESNPDGAVIAPLFASESDRSFSKCAEASIPTVIINTEMPSSHALCYIGQDSYQSGVIAARLLNFRFRNKATALLLNLDEAPMLGQHLHDKEKGFRHYFSQIPEKEVSVITRSFSDYRDPEALGQWMRAILEKQDNLQGIFVTNSRAYWLLDCLQERLLNDIAIVGFDLVEPNLKYLKNNRISFLINQNPVLQGYLGIINLVNHLILKEDIKKVQHLPLDIVVRENCDYYVKNHLTVPLSIY